MAGFANNAIDELSDAVYNVFTTFCSFGAGQRGAESMDSVRHQNSYREVPAGITWEGRRGGRGGGGGGGGGGGVSPP